MSNGKVKVYRGMLRAAVDNTVQAAEKVAERDRFRQIKEGKAHPLWLAGHLTNSMDTFVLSWIGGGESLIPKSFRRPFSPEFIGGNPVTTKADDYPGWDEVIETYKKVGEKAVEIVGNLDDAGVEADLKGPIPEKFKELFGNTERTLSITITHDAHHRGQIALLANLGD